MSRFRPQKELLLLLLLLPRESHAYLGEHICDVLDMFTEWREQSGSPDMRLISLALTAREAEVGEDGWCAAPSKGSVDELNGHHCNHAEATLGRMPISSLQLHNPQPQWLGRIT